MAQGLCEQQEMWLCGLGSLFGKYTAVGAMALDHLRPWPRQVAVLEESAKTSNEIPLDHARNPYLQTHTSHTALKDPAVAATLSPTVTRLICSEIKIMQSRGNNVYFLREGLRLSTACLLHSSVCQNTHSTNTQPACRQTGSPLADMTHL